MSDSLLAKIFLVFILLFFFLVSKVPALESISFDLLAGYAVPANESYIDTYQNSDIYWNPNTGINLDARLLFPLSDTISLGVPFNCNFGLYRYDTTDGRKVNTEAQAGNTPQTVNTEWAIAPDLGAMLYAAIPVDKIQPYFGIGLAFGMMHSWETWSFNNDDGDDVVLYISKFYDPTPVFKGEFGCSVPLKSGKSLRVAATFNMANYIMKKVVLTNYIVGGDERIYEYDEKSTIYNYAFNAPDENKGGDCLLAGFTYNNYPQQKISSNLTLKVGLAF